MLAGAAPSWAAINFDREIRPILSENCYHCHGPDEKGRKADLRLDKKEGLFRTKDGVTIIVPGKSAESELVERIQSTDPDEMMPSPKSHRTLTEAQKALLVRWVDEGAPWSEHWAFAPLGHPEPPTVASTLTVRNPIDAFIDERLEKEGLKPSPEASAETLLRRITLDLTGLPPTVEELMAYLTDPAPDRYEKAVDRLMASPRYGERMAWDWLEAARYADTNGYQGDPVRPMWPWRDWVVQALNDNMPFDQFTIEQLAGDLLPNPTRPQLIATGFHRNHMINGEGGRLVEESRVDYVMDRTETTGTVWLGLTFNCCRCHDHKFDALKQTDYYRLSAYFNSIDETGGNDAGGLANPVISLATDEQQKHLESLKSAEKEAKEERDALEKRLRSDQAIWEQTVATGEGGAVHSEAQWRPIAPDEIFAQKGSVLTKTADGAVVASGPSPDTEQYIFTAKVNYLPTAFKLVAEPDDAFVNKGPGRADNGNFVLTELTLTGDSRNVDLAAVRADFEQEGWPATGAFDGDAKTGWAVQPKFGEPHILLFEVRSAIGFGGSEPVLQFKLSFDYGRQHTLGKFRIYATTDSPALLREMPAKIRDIVQKAPAERSDADKEALTKYYLETNPELVAATRKRDAAKKARETEEKTLPRTMVMRDRAKPRDTFVLTKGNYDKPTEKVTPGVPVILPQLPAEAPANRLALAKWLVSPENPLTARVTINRLWQTFFGVGLVKTVSDFGVQGEIPSHPELLDWLAREFMNSGWDMKHMVRLMVTSAAYRQGSQVPAGMAERDPENRLLSHAPRYRWPSWMLRDQALAASGLLTERLGGPSVKTYQPAGVWEEATFGQIKFQQDHGDALYRRSLYVFWRRIVGPTVFFDVANRQNCVVKTARTNTPLQALVTLNDVTYVEAARVLAQRLIENKPDAEARIVELYRRVLSRAPRPEEKQILLARLNRLEDEFTADPNAAGELLAAGESPRNPEIPAHCLAAYTVLCSLALNLDETLSKQ